MFFLSTLMIFIGMFFYIAVLVDMFKQRFWFGLLGVFLFPVTFYHAAKIYLDKRKKKIGGCWQLTFSAHRLETRHCLIALLPAVAHVQVKERNILTSLFLFANV